MQAPTIIIDTREQEPYSFDACADPPPITIRHALPAGDYSLAGFETAVAVERKSLDDFVNTVIRGKERFRRELQRLQTYRAACIVVEASLRDIASGAYTSKMHPMSVLGHIVAISVDWGIPVYCCSDRQMACLFVWKWLMKWGERLSKQIKTDESVPNATNTY